MKLPYIGLEEVKEDKLLTLKQLLAEFIGTLLLVSRLFLLITWRLNKFIYLNVLACLS